MKLSLRKLERIMRKRKKTVFLSVVGVLIVTVSLFYYNALNATMINLGYVEQNDQNAAQLSLNTTEKKLEYLFDGNYERIKAIMEFSQKNNIPPLFTAAVIFAESDNRTRATSRVNARGLMQLMQPTAIILANAAGEKKLAKNIAEDPSILYDYKINIRLGTMFLRDLNTTYRNWQSTLHAYNVGPVAFKYGRRNHAYVNKIMKMYRTWEASDIRSIHAQYGNYLSSLYSKKIEILVMR